MPPFIPDEVCTTVHEYIIGEIIFGAQPEIVLKGMHFYHDLGYYCPLREEENVNDLAKIVIKSQAFQTGIPTRMLNIPVLR